MPFFIDNVFIYILTYDKKTLNKRSPNEKKKKKKAGSQNLAGLITQRRTVISGLPYIFFPTKPKREDAGFIRT